ncbi:MAG: hypothetical protein IT425_01770 [Pirellulales bacterium]|nr:hypothetical protein [Pirellulales bacterium]
MRIVPLHALSLLLIASLASGCQLFSTPRPFPRSQSPLKPAQASPDSVTMEIIWARFPANSPAISNDTWQAIDELQIDPAVRRELANNGLRAGVISGSLPPAIDHVLRLSRTADASSPPADEPTAAATTPQPKGSSLLTEPIVRGRVRQMPRNQRYEIQASETFPSIPVLLSKDAELGGNTFDQAQAIYALRLDPRPDQTALVELTPELHHGTPRLRYTGGEDGILRQDSLKEREVFDRLRLAVRLAPGDMLVLMGTPEAGSRLGHYFHSVASSEGPQQKLILIRLADTPRSNTFTE